MVCTVTDSFLSSVAVIAGALMISELIRMRPSLSSLLLGTRNRKATEFSIKR